MSTSTVNRVDAGDHNSLAELSDGVEAKGVESNHGYPPMPGSGSSPAPVPVDDSQDEVCIPDDFRSRGDVTGR